jgi:hypothetical protein
MDDKTFTWADAIDPEGSLLFGRPATATSESWDEALARLVFRTSDESWLLDTPRMARALCVGVRRSELPAPPREAHEYLGRLHRRYERELQDLTDSDDEPPLSFDMLPLDGLTLARLALADAAAGVLEAPLWVPLYALGGQLQRVAALLVVTELLGEVFAAVVVPESLSELVECVSGDLVRLVGVLDRDATVPETLTAYAEVLGRVAALAESAARVTTGCWDLADQVTTLGRCAACGEFLSEA